MKKKLNKTFSIILVLTILFDIVVFTKKTMFKKKDDLTNINELSEEFMDNYFKEVSEVKTEEEKDNMLIITSKEKLEDTYGATKIIEAPNHQYFLQYNSEEEKNAALKKFNSEDSNIDVSENYIHKLTEDTVLVSSYNSWGVEAMGVDVLLEKLKNKELNNVVVAIVDSGLDIDLFNKHYPGRVAGAFNVLENNDNMYDNFGHGTHIAGTIAEMTSSNVKILPVKTTDTENLFLSDILAAINYIAYNKNADVINMSFGCYQFSKGEYNAIQAAKESNIISVAAAGNDNVTGQHYPSAFDNTISVAAVDSNKSKANFSNHGDSIMFTAPGVDINSINSKDTTISKEHNNEDGDDEREVLSGTSMATPHIVGAVANLKSLNKNLKFDDAVTILRRYSYDLGDIGWDENYGYGIIDFTDAELCDNQDCDEYNVFKSSPKDNLEEYFDNYEIEPVLTTYNYASINNILNTKITINYTNGKTIEYKLFNIRNLEVSNYDPYSTEEQTVNIKFTTPLGIKIEASFQVTNPSTYENVWEYKIIEDNNIEITNYKDPEFDGNTLYMPSEIDGYTVTGIADGDNSIFANNWASFKKVQYLFLPSTLTKIGNNAFSGGDLLNGLNYVKSEAESIRVGDYAFNRSLTLIELDAKISYIGDYAFKQAQNIDKIQFSDDITHIGAGAFQDSLLDAKLVVPSTVTEIGSKAFYNSLLEEVTFMNDMETISEKLFYNSVRLKKITLPEGVKSIEKSGFEGCVKLTTINLPESLTTIGDRAFYETFESGSLTIPKNVISIGNDAFFESGLIEITFMNDMETIPTGLLHENFNLEKVTLPNGVKKIEDGAFWKCDKLKTINLPETLTAIGEEAFLGAFDSKENITLEIPKNVTNIGARAFSENGLKEIKIQSNIEDLPESIFDNSQILEKVTLPEGIIQIGKNAFHNCNNLTTINLPNTLTTIGDSAFENAFKDDNEINLTIPKNVTTIGDNSFKDIASGVKLYVYNNSVPKFYVHMNNINYTQIDPDVVSVQGINSQYHAFDTIDMSNVSLELTYNEETTRTENITENIEIEYPDLRDSLRYGDTSVKIIAHNSLGYEIEKDLEIEVLKVQPQYDIPNNLEAYVGQKLSEIELPEGFEWMNSNDTISQSGEAYYKAKYIPTDTTNYETVENIDVLIKAINKTIINPEITVENKTYDGTTTIPNSSITISNLESSEFSIISATSSSADAGERIANIKLKLSDDKFKNNSFDNGNQEKEFKVNYQILKANINVTDNSKDVTAIYDGKDHSIEMNLNYDQGATVKYMNDKNEYTLNDVPKYKESGTYVIKYKVYINDNYTEYFGQKTLIIKEKPSLENTYSVQTVDNINYISGINPKTKISDLNNLGFNSDYKIKIFNKDGQAIQQQDNIGTGNIIKVYANNQQEETVVDTYTVVVKGDINGDGLIELNDLLLVRSYILENPSIRQMFTNSQHLLIAGDYRNDSGIEINDFFMMRDYYLKN